MMDGSGDSQGQNDIGENYFASGQVTLEGKVDVNMFSTVFGCCQTLTLKEGFTI